MIGRRWTQLWILWLVSSVLPWGSIRAEDAAPTDGAIVPFRITVRDRATGRGVPLVELTTTDQTTYVTDSAGVVAFDEPGLLGHRVFFTVKSHGYRYRPDGFGFEGSALETSAGCEATLLVDRENVAERLYRITGQGIYRDSVLLGDEPPGGQPLLAAGVMGQDSCQAIRWRDRILWFYGDTSLPAYPLGLFEAAGAWSKPLDADGSEPAVGLGLTYFVDEKGTARAMCPIEGPGPVWIDGLLLVPDEQGAERLACRYMRMKSLGECLESGIALWNDERSIFEKWRQHDTAGQPFAPRGHPFQVEADGERFWYFPSPVPDLRVRATLAAVSDPSAYEGFTCLERGAVWDPDEPRIERDAGGRPVWGWKPGTTPIPAAAQRELVRSEVLAPGEIQASLVDVENGEPVLAHSGSVAWNPHRERWIMLFGQSFGKPSFLGEVWFAEAETPTGPWKWARKVITHDRYSFYNVVHHPFLDERDGRIIYLEGTYTKTFSAAPRATPRYDYNQIMYRLDLDDPRLRFPEVERNSDNDRFRDPGVR